MEISKNNESDNNDTNIEIDKLEVENSFMLEHAKKQEKIDEDNELKIILGMKSTVNLDTSIYLQLQLRLKNQKPVYCCVLLRPNS